MNFEMLAPMHEERGILRQSHGSPDWDVLHYDLALVLDPDARSVDGVVTIDVQSIHANPGDLILDSTTPEIDEVRVDGVVVAFSRTEDSLSVPITSDRASVAVRFHHRGSGSDTVTGLKWDPIRTFAEPEGARSWFPCHDDPSDKAMATFHVTVPSNLVAVANGDLQDVAEQAGWRTWTYDFAEPIPTYLMVVDADEFALDIDDRGSVPIYTWAPPDQLAATLQSVGDTSAMIDYLNGWYGPYRWTRYGNVIVPFGGGMEHTTATTFGDELVGEGSAELVNVHELGHHWWGDDVTCQNWDEIWLNEGFATFTEMLWVEHAWGDDVAVLYRIQTRARYFAWHAVEGTSPLVPPNFLWGGTVYDKGGLVLHMLRREIGDEAMKAGLQEYRANHSGANATTPDLQIAMESASGEDLQWFFDQWVYRAGDPVLTVGSAYDGEQIDLRVQIDSPDAWRLTVPADVYLSNGTVIRAEVPVLDNAGTWSQCASASIDHVVWDPEADVLIDETIVNDAAFEPAERVCRGEPLIRGSCSTAPTSGGGSWLLAIAVAVGVRRKATS